MIYFIFSSLFISFFASIFFFYILALLPPKKGRFKYGGVYSVTSSYYHIKYAIIFVILKFKKWHEKEKYIGPLILYDAKERSFMKSLEKLHDVEKTDLIDSVYFYCTGNLKSRKKADDEKLERMDIILRIARRMNRINEHWIMIRKNNESLLLNQNAPMTSASNCSSKGWTTMTGVSIQCDRPNEKWTVKYNGWLRNTDKEDNQIHVNLKISFTAFTNIFDSHKDTSVELSADAIARESWSRKFFNELKNFKEKNQTHYEQWGGYNGTITFGREETFQLRNCKGYRDHSFGLRNWSQYQRYGTFFGYFENGGCFSLGSVCCRNTLSHIRHGYYIAPYGDIRPVTQHNFDLWKYFLTAPPRSQCTVEFFAGGERFELTCMETAQNDFDVNGATTKIYERFMTFKLNGIVGHGVGEFCASDSVPQYQIKPISSINILHSKPVLTNFERCISLKDEGSRERRLCGGKGSHLGDLTKLSKIYEEIIVPDSFVLTTVAFDIFLENNENIESAINKLKEMMKNASVDEMRIKCEDIRSMIINGDIPSIIQQDLLRHLDVNIGNMWHQEKLAVRSSSADEDSAEASSAGQMETFLGLQGEDEIIQSIKRCWASQYSYQAVSYRSRNGQVTNSKMAVVVMRMIQSHSSGVLFTANPLDGDSTRMIINSSFGLGESIVSGKCVPDNIVVEIDINGELKIQSKEMGGKEIRIDMKKDGHGLLEQEVENQNVFSLTDEEIIKLAKIGVLIQQCYGEPSDIEWAWCNETFYILQVRPITSLNVESDEDFIHEFDSSLSVEEECLTSANIGEMMPMAVTPLTLSVFGSAVDSILQTIPVLSGIYKTFIYPRRCVPSFSNHLFINLHCMLIMPVKSAFFSDIRMVFLALLGRVLKKPTKEDIVRFSGTTSFVKSVMVSILSFKNRFQGTKKTIEWENKLKCGYKVPIKSTAAAQMAAISHQMNDYYLCWLDTVHNTSQSAIWSMVLMKILETKEGWNQTVYSQMATLLSTCSNVYSADVPTELKKIALAICQNPTRKDLFVEMDIEGCIKWVNSVKSEDVGELYQQFLKRHGHRCIREAEFRETSWRTDQRKLISALKVIVSHLNKEDTTNKIELSIDDAIDSLQLKVNPLKKKLIKWLLGKARKGVGLREWGKSLSIQMCEVFKLAFYNLGSLMVNENLIPDSDLVFFFTNNELMSILVDKDEPISKFIGRALRRRKVIDKQMKATYPELSFGTPEEKFISQTIISSSSLVKKINGLPVSVGIVEGLAQVIRTVEEAESIKLGDILIVPYTDVGWTPYFPLLGGLITEKGGFLSHGAVVAREYGLPCIVGCEGCTTFFKTGERIILNATQGTVELIRS